MTKFNNKMTKFNNNITKRNLTKINLVNII